MVVLLVPGFQLRPYSLISAAENTRNHPLNAPFRVVYRFHLGQRHKYSVGVVSGVQLGLYGLISPAEKKNTNAIFMLVYRFHHRHRHEYSCSCCSWLTISPYAFISHTTTTRNDPFDILLPLTSHDGQSTIMSTGYDIPTLPTSGNRPHYAFSPRPPSRFRVNK